MSSNGIYKADGKVAQTSAQLETMARSLGDHVRLPGVRELRAQLGVSLTTLQEALGDLEGREVIYRRQGSGIFVSPRRDVRNILMLCDYSHIRSASHSPFWDIVADKAMARAASHREQVRSHFTSTLGNEGELLPPALMGEVLSGRVHGIVAASIHDDTARGLRQLKVPFVSFGARGQGTVFLAEHTMLHLGVRALKERGCKRIGIWRPVAPHQPDSSESASVGSQLLQTFADAMREEGLEFEPHCVEYNLNLVRGPGHITRLSKQEQGYETAQRVFCPSGEKPDGIVVTDDLMTHGALSALQNMGIQAGRDVQIASHANKGSVVLLGQSERLVLLEFDPSEVVEALFGQLETLMDGHSLERPEIFVQPTVRTPSRPQGF